MGADSKIEWTDHTFNAWWGCVRVSPGCEHCYAESFAKRTGHKVWGVEAPRRFFGDKHWAKPREWDREQEQTLIRRRVFCGSMMDVFERPRNPELCAELDRQRARLWALIDETPGLDWQLLTKRPENVRGMVPWAHLPRNVWIGTSAEDQERWNERIPHLLRIPAFTVFVSAEPLLGPIDCGDALEGIEWLIVGGESGHGARPFDIAWARSLVAQGRAAGSAVFVKQLGSKPTLALSEADTPYILAHGHTIREQRASLHLRSAKGGDWSEWPEELRVREMPAAMEHGERRAVA